MLLRLVRLASLVVGKVVVNLRREVRPAVVVLTGRAG